MTVSIHKNYIIELSEEELRGIDFAIYSAEEQFKTKHVGWVHSGRSEQFGKFRREIAEALKK